MSRRFKGLIVAVAGGALCLLTYWRLDSITDSGSLLPVQVAIATGAVGAVAAAVVLALIVDIPPHREGFRSG